MCLECGIVCTNIPPGRDNCNECTNKSSSFSSTTTTSTSSTTQSSNELNEMIEFIEDMGFERPVILAAIMKLQLDDEPNINTENVVVAINDLMAPLKNETSPPKQETVTSTSSTSSLYPPLSPTASNQVPPPIFQPPTSLPSPSAPPLHSQHSEGLDNDRTKCKVFFSFLFSFSFSFFM